MKFLQDPVEEEVVSILTEIQALFSNITKALIDVKSKSMQCYLEKIEKIPQFSLAELESMVAGNNKDLVAYVVKNGSKKYSYLENKFDYEKQKALTTKEVTVKKAFYEMMPQINVEKFNDKDNYEELVAIYSDAANVLKKKAVKDSVVVALVDYILSNIFNMNYNNQKINENNYLINRFAGLVILTKDNALLSGINEVFNKNYQIPKIEQNDKPLDIYKTLEVKILKNDDFVTIESLNFKDVDFINWDTVFANKNVSTKYLTILNNYFLFSDKKNDIYLVEKTVKLVPIDLNNYTYVKKEIFDEKTNHFIYPELLNCVMINMFKKPDLFKQYSFFERENSVGMFEKMEVFNSGRIQLNTIEMILDKYGELNLKYFKYDTDVSKLSEFKPASDLKMNLFLMKCERNARIEGDYSIKNALRNY